MASPRDAFVPKDTLANTTDTTIKTTVGGAIAAGVQNALRKQNVGAMGIFTRSGHILALFAGAGAAYQFSMDASANLRQKDDSYNHAIGGFMVGAAIGLQRRSIPFMLGAGAGSAVVMAALNYTQGLRGPGVADDDEDAVARKEALKKARRRPLSETIDELGEGRGIYAPGYEERRRQRLLAKYGIDVGEAPGPKSSTTNTYM